MIKRTHKLIMTGFLFLSLFANSEEVNKNDGSLNIPYSLVTESYESDIIIDEANITILAKKRTDLYTNADGSNSNDNAPRVFFEPKSDFTLSAKVTADFTTAYDGGALFLYADTDNWGKLLFERFKSGDNGIASTITRLTGDDAYHYLVKNNYIYLKIVRKKNKFTFLYSESGEEWSYLRSFSLTTLKAIKVGFIAQSPISNTHKVVYSDILFKE
jgi:regulation of enolase protein 1 (concanavalin A-like superfamily)